MTDQNEGTDRHSGLFICKDERIAFIFILHILLYLQCYVVLNFNLIHLLMGLFFLINPKILKNAFLDINF